MKARPLKVALQKERRLSTRKAPEKPSLKRLASFSVVQSLMLRAGLALALMGIALAGHWFDRDGLRDNADGVVSFIDVIYFTTVTVTTVGYGDIVPVTPQARLFDALVVTPIRLFMWLIFLGTAYTFVLRRTWERMRGRMIEKTLRDHLVVCGFGSGGEAAVAELLRQDVDPKSIVVVEGQPERAAAAMEMGVTTVEGDATHDATLDAARIDTACGILVSVGRDDTAALVVLSARRLNGAVPISASVQAVENEDLLRQAGASSVINPVSLGGHLLARSSTHRGAVDYIRDLAVADGRVVLRERAAQPDEVGKPLSSIRTGLGVRLLRAGSPVGFWEAGAAAIEPGDAIIEIVPVAPSAAGS